MILNSFNSGAHLSPTQARYGIDGAGVPSLTLTSGSPFTVLPKLRLLEPVQPIHWEVHPTDARFLFKIPGLYSINAAILITLPLGFEETSYIRAKILQSSRTESLSYKSLNLLAKNVTQSYEINLSCVVRVQELEEVSVWAAFQSQANTFNASLAPWSLLNAINSQITVTCLGP